jgi:hypothetical protein
MEIGAAIPATSSDAIARYSFFLDITVLGGVILPSIFMFFGFLVMVLLPTSPESRGIVGKMP